MKKNWRTKLIASIAIVLIAFAFAAPVNALDITSGCNKVNSVSDNNTSAKTVNCKALFEIGICSQSLSDSDECRITVCENNTLNNDKSENQSVKAETIAVSGKNINDYWTKILNNIKQYLPSQTKPETPAQPTKPTEPATPTEPEKPTTPTKPAEPATPATPTKPTEPATPTTPSKPEQPAKPTTPTTPSAPAASLSAQEQQMVNLVNSERAKAGLKPLTVDTNLAKVARIKSQDMIDKGYFSHTSPTYGSPFDMMKSFGITYRTAGENLALNSSVQKAHTALMNSQGHRANILNSSFTHIGIGIASKGSSLYITQMFIGK